MNRRDIYDAAAYLAYLMGCFVVGWLIGCVIGLAAYGYRTIP